ncbi:MAG TPA: hypothetical protein PKA41_03350 [Verrucomicrobiota bacterium]|nr:hypothetical protein [Verrucomicrobiota bacterium]
MKIALVLAALLSFAAVCYAQTSAFTYQGRLLDGGSPAGTNYDMRFTLHSSDNQTNANQVGSVVNVVPVPVSNGLFKVSLDFGAIVFDGTARWLQINVRPYGDTNAYVSLSPRQLITSTPYAIRSINAVNATTAVNVTGPLPATNVIGSIASSNLPPNVALLNSNAFFTGSVSATQFNGSGAGLSNVSAASLTGTVSDARLSPNVALLNANATFNGTVTATNFVGYGGGLTNVPGRIFEVIPTGSAIQAQANTGYLTTNPSAPVVVTLPPTMRVGETVRVSASGAGGWVIAQNPGQSVYVANILNTLGQTWVTNTGSVNWSGLAMSEDGSTIAGVATGNFIFVSTNSGSTWTNRDSVRNWSSVAMSADGTKMVAAVRPGFIYTSANSGGTWQQQNNSGNRGWSAVASSLDGTHLVGVVTNGLIYTSPDSGATWTPRAFPANWVSVACSGNASNLVAVVQGGRIYTSPNFGATWKTNGIIAGWKAVASSSDGSAMVAVPNPGQIHTSSDFGSTWSPLGTSAAWASVASSADGSRIIAGVNPGVVSLSTDFGFTWRTPGALPSNLGWNAVAMSGDGSTAAAAPLANGIYITGASSTTVGTNGLLSGARLSAVELQYIGDGQFMPISFTGNIHYK